jgi:hypothetical protein
LADSLISRGGIVRASIVGGQFIGPTDGSFKFSLAFVTALGFTELLVQGSLGVIGEREGRFSTDDRSGTKS